MMASKYVVGAGTLFVNQSIINHRFHVVKVTRRIRKLLRTCDLRWDTRFCCKRARTVNALGGGLRGAQGKGGCSVI